MAVNLQKTEFILSAASPKDFLRDGLPQIAFAGRSNVGKSSVINRLLNRKNVYFVPFGQDDPAKKPCSLQADFSLMYASVEAAMAGAQLQPILTAK